MRRAVTWLLVLCLLGSVVLLALALTAPEIRALDVAGRTCVLLASVILLAITRRAHR